jgi:hypothetical protein
LIIDARDVSNGKTVSSDICIVGAGVAGLALASELRDRKFRVSIIECGGIEPDKPTQALFWGESIGQPYFPLASTRACGYGGTSHRWLINLLNGQLGVRLRGMDSIDFEKRDWVPYSGWPLSKSDLIPYYRRAHAMCKIGPYTYDSGDWQEPSRTPSLPFNQERVNTTIFQFAERRAFYEDLSRVALNAENIDHYIYGNIVEIATDEYGMQCIGLKVACLNGNHFWMQAGQYILAMGALEIPRLMLISNKVQKQGIGNQHDLVGRFFMEHLHLWSGTFVPKDGNVMRSTGLYRLHYKGKTPIMGKWVTNEDIQRRERLLNYCVSIHPDVSVHRPNIAPKWRINSWPILKPVAPAKTSAEPSVVKHLLRGPYQLAKDLLSKYKTPVPFFKLNHMTEQSPNPASRIRLSEEKDVLGRNRIQLDWRLTSFDMSSLIRSQEIIDAELRSAGLGKLQIALRDETDTQGVQGGWHHMGTTRMHDDPKKGVVDSNCRVHGMNNLYIAGPSVFPTSGYANPVLTIVALSIRLADKLKTLMNR